MSNWYGRSNLSKETTSTTFDVDRKRAAEWPAPNPVSHIRIGLDFLLSSPAASFLSFFVGLFLASFDFASTSFSIILTK